MPNSAKPMPLGLLFHTIFLTRITANVEANTLPVMLTSPKDFIYPDVDHGLNESLYPNAAATAKEIANIIEMTIRKQYATDIALRDAHPKAHGCVRAEFKINETLPQNMAYGVFIPGKTYPAWIRFSNGSSNAKQADIKKDARSMAIKILAAPQKNLLDEPAATQDFIMINHPIFFVNDPARYLSFIKDIDSDRFLK